MKNRADVMRRVEAYLQEVERHLAGRTADVREEVVRGLRDHLLEAIRRVEESGPATIEQVEQIIAEMDPPETFAEAVMEGGIAAIAAAGSKAGRGPLARWFLLGVAFLLINGYGVWRWTDYLSRIEAQGGKDTTVEETTRERILRLRKVEQMDVTKEREVMLRLMFSDRPARDQLSRYLHLKDSDGKKVSYQIMGSPEENALMVQTDPVLTEKLHYSLAAGFPCAGESEPMDAKREGSLKIEVNLVLQKIETESPAFDDLYLNCEFAALPVADKIKDYVEIVPEVKYHMEQSDYWWRRAVFLRGDFEPGQIYEVRFKEGLPASNGATLPRDIVRKVQFPLRNRGIRLAATGRYLAPGGSLSIPVEASGLDTFTAKMAKVVPHNLVFLAQREEKIDGWPYRGLSGVVEDMLTTGCETNVVLPPGLRGEVLKGTIHLRQLFKGEPRGVFYLEAAGKDVSSSVALVVVSDLGAAARVFPDKMLVWVNQLTTTEAVPAANVTVFARNNTVIGRGVTDEQGLCEVELADGQEPYLVTVEKDEDLTYLDLHAAKVTPAVNTGGRDYLRADQVEAAVFTERGIYRPKEKVLVQALVRDHQMRAPVPFPALVRVYKPDWRLYREFPVELDDYGWASVEVELPEYLPTGNYFIHLAMPGTLTVLGTTRVALEDFVPPQVRAKVEAPKTRTQAGEVMHVKVRADHLFGAPAAGLRVDGEVNYHPAAFSPKEWPGWVFEDSEKKLDARGHVWKERLLDENGEAEYVVDTSKNWQPPAAVRAVFAATIREASGRAVTAYEEMMVDAYPFYVGLKPAWKGSVKARQPHRISVVEVQPDARPVAKGKPLVLTLWRVEWTSVLRENRHKRYEWRSVRHLSVVRTDTLAAGGEPEDWEFTITTPGDYMIEAKDPASGASSRLSFQVFSGTEDWGAWSRETPGHIELAWDREMYRPGDTARLQIRAPFGGRALFTVENRELRHTRVVSFDKNTAELEVEVDESFAPNVWCTLSVIRPAKPEAIWGIHRASGCIPLKVERPETKITAALEVPKLVAPQTTLSGTLTLRREDGAPATGRACVMAVDEGICLLTDFVSPDPRHIFEAHRALVGSAHDLYAELMPIVDDQLESTPAPGGDAGILMARRLNPIKANRFKPVALWAEDLPVDEEGRVQFSLDIPEFSGELRVMAVAYNQEQIGATSTPVVVRRDLVAQSALPRFMAIGDQAECGIALYNEGAGEITVTVRATSGGPLQAEPAEQALTIAPKTMKMAPLSVKAGPSYGKGLITLSYDDGKEPFQDVIEMPVRPAAASSTTTSFQKVEPGAGATIAAPANWLPESVTVSGSMSGAPSLQFARALEYLVHYPYGCLEQVTSGAFPLLYAGNWLDRLPPTGKALGDVEEMIAHAITEALVMQRANGGFAYWPFLANTSDPPSIYAIHFLVEANHAGFAVPTKALNSALNFLRDMLGRKVTATPGSDEWRDNMQWRAYACHVLAAAGKPDTGWNARLREQAHQLNFASRVHIAAALLLAGEPRQGVELLEGMDLPVIRRREAGEIFNSSVRDAALMLSTWLEVDPAHDMVDRLAVFLLERQIDGHWGNTQDNALALLALGKMARTMPDTPQVFAGALTLPGRGTSAFGPTNHVTWLLGPGAGDPLSVTNDGPGNLYLWVQHMGVGVEPEPPLTNGVSIQREFMTPEGNILTTDTITQGDVLVVRLTLDPQGNNLDHMIVEDLLPAGLEIENANPAVLEQVGWLRSRKNGEGDAYRDARDDRMLIFSGRIAGQSAQYHYMVRAVTPGTYVLPPPTVSGMYEPEIRGVGAGGRLVVKR